MKDQWHFSFKCLTREKIIVIIAETTDSDSEVVLGSGLPGII